ncbi:hypothetical protein CD137_05475, partial [Staphylococcus petrasii]
MNKRSQGPINKKVDFLPNRLNKYSIRKFTVGTASILVGASLVFGVSEEAHAAENTSDANATAKSDSNQIPTSEVTTETTTQQPSSTEETKTQQTNEVATTEQTPTKQASSEEKTQEQSSQENVTSEPSTQENKTAEQQVSKESTQSSEQTTQEQPSTEEQNMSQGKTKQEQSSAEKSTHESTQESSTEEQNTTSEDKTAQKDTKKAEKSTENKSVETPTKEDKEKASKESNNSEVTKENSKENQSAQNKKASTEEVASTEKANTEKNVTAKSNNISKDTKAKKINISKDSSVKEKKAYTSEVLDELNIDKNNQSNIQESLGENIDLESASKDEINNAIVAEALKEDFTNPDYGVNTPIALASNTATSSATNSPVNNVSPATRLKFRTLLAVSKGRNVNDKITISNDSLTLKKYGSHADNIIWPTTNEQFNIQANYALDDSITEGDTFTIQYGTYIRPGGLELPAKNVDLRSDNGSIVATGVYDENTNTTTYTFTNYVDQYSNITGNFKLIATPKRATANKDNQTYPMDVTIANKKISKNFTVDYGNHKDQTVNAAVSYVDNANNEHAEVAYLNVNNNTTSPMNYTKYFSTVTNGQFIPGKVKVYEVLNSNAMVDSFNPDFNNSSLLKEVTNFTPTYSNNNTRVDITFGNAMKPGSNKKYIVSQAVKPSGTGNVQTVYTLTNSAGSTIDGSSTTVSNIGGSSSASGVNANYKLGDKVWNDANKNGIQDSGEEGISGVYVTLKNSQGTELQRVTTDASGNYQFTNLQNGNYTVEFAIPKTDDGTYYTPTVANAGDDTKDSDGVKADNSNIVKATGTINNSDNLTVDTGFYLDTPKPPETHKIGNYVWKDLNDDGIQNDGDNSGIQGVTVTLTNNATNETKTVQTDAKGYYEFAGLSNGTYTIQFNTPNNMVDAKTGTTTADKDSNPSRNTVVINDADDMTIDKGYVPVYSIGDKVWEDTNKDGIQDSTEKGLKNVSVELRKDGNVIDRTTTDDNGNYLFTNVKNGTYTVVFNTPDGYKATLANEGNDRSIDSNGTSSDVVINNANNLTIDSGFYKEDTPQPPQPNTPKYNVGDRVWNDTNHNGIQDEGEKGIGGVTVLLKKDGKTINNTVTDRDGMYGFHDLEEGEYTIEFIDPDGYTASPKNAPGSTNANDSNGSTVRIELHNDDNTIDYGLYKNPQLGYEITVEDKSYENIVRENKALPKDTIKLVQQGKDGRDRVFYKELGYNPDLTGIDSSKLLHNDDGYYWQEVKRDHIYTSQDAIFEYNLDTDKVVKDITYNNTNNTYKVTFTDGSDKTLPGTPGITITNTTTNDNGDIVIHFSDGNSVVIPKGTDGKNGIPGPKGEDGKSSTITTTPLTDEKGNVIGTTITVTQPDGTKTTQNVYNGEKGDKGDTGAKGDKGDQGPKGDKGDTGAKGDKGEQGSKGDKGDQGEPGKDGQDAKPPQIEQTPILDKNGNQIGVTVTIKDAQGNEVSHENIYNGKDGKTPTVEQTPVLDKDGNQIGVTIITKDGDGNEVSRQDVLNGKNGKDGVDGKDGQSVTAVVTEGTKDGRDGSYVRTYVLNPDGTRGDLISEAFVPNGKDGKTPTIDQQPIKDKDGNQIGTTVIVKDGDGNEVNRQDIYNGKDGKDGQNGKTPTVEQTPIRDEKGNQIGVTIITKDGDGKEISHQDIYNGSNGANGKDGKTPSVEAQPIKDEKGNQIGVTIITKDGDGNEVSRQDVLNGKDGKNGHSITAETVPGTQNGRDGSYIRIYEINPDGTRGNLISETFVPNGKDGKNPSIEQEPIRDKDGNQVGVTIITKDVDGNEIKRENIYNGKDGKDGRSVITETERGNKDGRDGSYVRTYEINPDGSKGKEISSVFIPDGKDGKTPTVEQQPIKDKDGNNIGVTIITKDGDGKEISREDIYNGKDGLNGKDGKDGVDGKTPSVEQRPIRDEKGNQIGTTIIVKDGDGNEVSREDIYNGKDGKTPSIEQQPILDKDGNQIGVTIITKDGDGKVLKQQDVLNGKDGKDGKDGIDGKTPSVDQIPIRDEKGNQIGTTIIVKDGDGKEISRQDVLNGKDGQNGKDGKTPSIEEQPIKDEKGNQIGVTIIIKDGNGKEIERHDILNGKDGKDGKDGRAVTAITEPGTQNGVDGSYVRIYEVNPDGSQGKLISETFIANGKDGKDGVDGKTPSIDQQPILDKDGKQIGTTVIVKDGNGKEVSRQDIYNGKDGENGKDGKDGVDGKTPSIEQQPILDKDGNQIGTTVIVKDGNGNEVSREDIYNGKDGKTPSIEQRPITDKDGNQIGVTIITKDGDGNVVKQEDVFNGRNGKDGENGKDGKDGIDGKSPSVEQRPIRDEQGNQIGVTIIVKDGDGKEVSRQDVLNGKDGKDGKDGKSPSVEEQPIRDKDGNQIGITIIVKDGDGKEVGRQDVLNGKDGKDGQNGKDGRSVTAITESGTQNGVDGSYVRIYEVNPDGSQGKLISETFIANGKDGKDGQDGKTPNIEQQPILDKDGKQIGTTVIVKDGNGKEVSRQDIYNGKDGQNGKNGKDGINGKTPSIDQQPILDKDGNQIGTTVIVKDGNGNEVSREDIYNGKNGKTPSIEQRPITDKDGNQIGITIITKDGDGNVVKQEDVFNGRDGKDGQNGKDGVDGKSPSVEQRPIRDEQGNQIGVTIIVKDGNGKEVSRQDVLNGKDGKDGVDGKTPSVEEQPIRDKDGNQIGITIIVKDGNGKEVGRQDIYNGKDGKDGQDGHSVTAVTERGTQNGVEGSYIRIYEVNADGSRGKLISETFVADGKDGKDGQDGKTPTIDQQPILDKDGKQIGTTVI